MGVDFLKITATYVLILTNDVFLFLLGKQLCDAETNTAPCGDSEDLAGENAALRIEIESLKQQCENLKASVAAPNSKQTKFVSMGQYVSILKDAMQFKWVMIEPKSL
jgi:hypothetical protein